MSPDASLHTELRSPCTSLPWRGDARSVQGVCSCVARAWQRALAASARRRKAWRAERKALRTTRSILRRVLILHLGGGNGEHGGSATAHWFAATLQNTEHLHCDEIEALGCGIARDTPHIYIARAGKR